MQRQSRAFKRLGGLVTLLAALGCAHRRETTQRAVELRGLYRVDFETSRFQPCADSGRLGYRVRADSTRWTQSVLSRGAATRSGGMVYYVRWVAEILPDTAPPLPAGWVRIGGGPTVRVRDVLEMRPPQAGECGWRPPSVLR